MSMGQTPTEQDLADARALMLSPTMSRLCGAAIEIPADLHANVHDRESLKSALAAVSIELVHALDAERIHFDQDDDRAVLLGLLLVAFQVMFDGRFAKYCDVTEAGHA